MSALQKIRENLANLPGNFRRSVVRHGAPSSERARSQVVFSNFFLHVQSTRVHLHSLRPSTTWGLGFIALVLFGILCATGTLLMVYYKPSVDQAYDSIKDIGSIVPTGRMMRNVHRWSAHAMVFVVLLHMARVFFTGSYAKQRSFNWVVGMVLLVLTLGLSFTGYLLPWDQLAYWAITIGSNIAQSPREVTDVLFGSGNFDVGGVQRDLLLGASTVGQEALIRFYVLHVIVLPVVLIVFCGVHFWRIRKDGGLNRPDDIDQKLGKDVRGGRPIFAEGGGKTYGLMALVKGSSPAVGRGPEHTVPSWPHMFYGEMLLLVLTTLIVLALGFFFDAPLKEIANAAVPENPAKAPWYFLGLQELVSYSAFSGGIFIPSLVVIGLMLIPYLDRETEGGGVWFAGPRGKRVALVSMLFAAVFVVAMLAFTVNYGWLRNWYPDISQLAITALNPGTVFLVGFAAWSLATVRTTGSTRLGAIALFTCFLVSFAILTYFATYMRGPNWDFFWSPGHWPEAH